MHFEQLYLGCLAQASYLIASRGEAVVVDPRRDADVYLQEAARHGLRLTHTILTHVHADFVAGHSELAARAGTRTAMGSRARCTFDFVPVQHGEELRVGDAVLRFLETPGHTPESICVLVQDATGKQPTRLLTGDTLFVGDAGRPDLVGAQGHTPQQMAAMLYDSLRERIATLPDDVEMWPGHGAGSACGRSIGSETSSTIGAQKRSNLALRDVPREEFVATMTTGLAAPPRYFAHAAELNRRGPMLLADLPQLLALAPHQLLAEAAEGVVVLDVRPAGEFGRGHVPGAINIGLQGQFEVWCGALLPPTQALALVGHSEEAVAEAQVRLARVGIENVAGYLGIGMEAFADSGLDMTTLPPIGVRALHEQLERNGKGWQVVDVRRPAEYASGRVPGALSLPLDELEHRAEEIEALDRDKPTAVICAGGYRSSIACHFFERYGFTDLLNVTGGTGAWVAAGLPTES